MGINIKRCAIAVILLVSFLLSPVTLAAQVTVDDWSRLNTVVLGSKLSIKLKSGKTVDGKLNSVTDTTLSISVKDKPLDLKREDILTVNQITKKSATKSTLIGMGVGAGAGAGIGAAGAGSDDNDFDKIDHAVIGGFAVVGAAAGALTGYLLGRGGTKRVLIYQAK